MERPPALRDLFRGRVNPFCANKIAAYQVMRRIPVNILCTSDALRSGGESDGRHIIQMYLPYRHLPTPHASNVRINPKNTLSSRAAPKPRISHTWAISTNTTWQESGRRRGKRINLHDAANSDFFLGGGHASVPGGRGGYHLHPYKGQRNCIPNREERRSVGRVAIAPPRGVCIDYRKRRRSRNIFVFLRTRF